MSQPLPPLQSPQALNYAPPPAPARGDLREIAVRQKAIMFCILGYISCVVLSFIVGPPLNLIFGLLGLAVSVTAVVFVFMLSLAIYNTATGIILGLLTLIPLINLIVLLVINGKATNILRAHGIRVGLMGAATNEIPERGQQPLR
jgi:hypothetical protein